MIQLQGWACIFTPADGFDLVATHEDKFIRIQVKAAGAPERRGNYRFGCVSGGDKKKLTTSSADIVALVAIDIRRVYFMPVKFISASTVRKHRDDFTPFVESESWFHSVNNVIASQWSN